MKHALAILFIGVVAAAAKDIPSLIDTVAFQGLTSEVLEYRNSRTVSADRFAQLMKQEGVILLDTRSRSRYERKHLAGAVHLNFSDFTKEALAKVIPDKDTTVLIYCNNNIANDPVDFASKAPALALNVPTFINLYGYGYKNVYELGALIRMDDDRFAFQGSATQH